jgi:hypothetical protein
VLKAVAFSVPAEPRALVKNPSFSATSAEACVTFVRKPSRTVTGAAAAAALAVVPLELVVLEDEDEEEEQPAASSRAAPIIAAAVTRRISHPYTFNLYRLHRKLRSVYYT